MNTTTVDTRGLSCPEPVILVKKALENKGRIEVLLDNRTSVENVTRFINSTGRGQRLCEEANGEFRIFVDD